ncbi:MAG TPA: ribosome biogenesis GTPase Der [Candidatus Saccharimonadales bacterium]|jgi:GTP-binding protein
MSKLPYVAIVGRTNAGKSSLFNRLYGTQEAIVAREAGTTRDNVVRKLHYDTGALWLIDTAGLKPAEDEFEASIQEQIYEASELANVIVMVVDGTEYPGDEERRVAKTALRSKKPVVLVINKTDLRGALPNDEFMRLGIRAIIRTSAEHNVGTEALLGHIISQLPTVRDDDEQDDVLRLALIGRPNVGKSRLFNTLAGKQQAIVANVAGTTRDVNRITIRYHGRDVELLDTAGVRRPGRQEVGIEKFSVLRTLAAVDEADVCLLLMDVNELSTALDQKLAGLIKEAGKGLIIVVSKWDSVEGKDAYTRDALAPTIVRNFAFVPWAQLIFTSAETGQNVTKLFDLAMDIDLERQRKIKTSELNRILQACVTKHPPAGLKNTLPKLRYMVQTDVRPPWFVIYGSNLRHLHWSYKRYLERSVREGHGFTGTPINFSFRDEKQIKANKQRIAEGKEPLTKANRLKREAEAAAAADLPE